MDVHVLVSSLLCAMAGFPAKIFVLVLTIASFEDGFHYFISSVPDFD